MINKKILIVGGRGFLGSWLCNYLQSSNNIIIIDKDRTYNVKTGFEHIYDFRHKHLISREIPVYNGFEEYEAFRGLWAPDIIIQLAATPIEAGIDSLLAERQLVDDTAITLRTVSHARQTNARLVFMSSVFAYGNYLYATPEDRQLEPTTPYGISKATGEYLVRNNVMNWNVIRTTSVYGYGDKNKRATTIIAEKSLKGEPFKVNKSPWLDFIYIKDLVEGIIKVMEADTNGAYNVSGGYATTLLEYTVRVGHFCDTKQQYEVFEDNDRPMRGTLSNDKMRMELQWSPRYSLINGVEDYVGYIKKYGYELI